ncbi:hypothetical protein FJY63_09520 [Candidatus Sumerlaeota bacterium]|nr:hypothetical protein [Candidatus Sumerlaeota bacterium]
MARTITLKESLVYYDGVQLFVAADQIDTRYLCVLIDRGTEADTFVCIPISAGRLDDFCAGEIELREICEKRETPEVYLAGIGDAFAEAELEEVPDGKLQEEWLPAPGFFFAASDGGDEEIAREATRRHRAIVHIAASPPEARGEVRISTSHLSEILSVFQTTLKHAYRKAIAGFDKATRKLLESPDNYAMDVYGFSPGSFTIQLQSKRTADMFGYVAVCEALKKLDELTENADQPDSVMSAVQRNAGNLAGSYLKLLESIIRNDAPLSYSWAAPDRAKSVTRAITKRQAVPLYDRLSVRRELTGENVELIGRVVKADVTSGSWALQSDDGKKHNGTIAEGSGIALDGIVIRTQKYRFACVQHIEEILGIGRERMSLELVKFEPA